MFGNRVEEEFVNNVSGADDAGRGRSQWPLLLLMAALIGAFVVWASVFEIEEVTRGQGRVIPSTQLQVVESLEGGLVRTIHVREGDLVEQGQVLMQIDDTSFASQQGELQEREGALLAEKQRLEAEAMLAETLSFPEDLVAENPLATAAEMDVFLSRRDQLSREVAVLSDQLTQRESELAELVALQDKRRKMIAPLSEEQALTEKLTETGAVPQIELLRLNSRLAELEGDLAVGQATGVRVAAAIDEVHGEIAATQSAYVLEARQRLARLQVELAIVQETLTAANDRVTRTQLRSPVRGTINRLNVTTLGAVVQPGEPVAEIVPADDGLLIEASILPSDVAFITPDAVASVKISAYDYLVYGALSGQVVRIGADTITDGEGGEFFRVIVRTDENHLGDADDPLPISPGMVAGVDIQTGRKTVLDYLLNPLRRAQAEALRER